MSSEYESVRPEVRYYIGTICYVTHMNTDYMYSLYSNKDENGYVGDNGDADRMVQCKGHTQMSILLLVV